MRTPLPVIKKLHKAGKVDADPLHGLFEVTIDGQACVVEYEPDSDLRDTETGAACWKQGGIEAFFRREVLPHAPDAWIDEAKVQDRLRDQLHPLLLQAEADENARRNSPRYRGP